MNQILKWLAGGDLRSDGLSNEAAKFALQHPELIHELVAGLGEPDDVIRGRTADALEKIARSRPDLLIEHLPRLIELVRYDPVPMVKMHVAMMLGHLALYQDHVGAIKRALFELLDDESVFAASWAIVSLCILGRMYPHEQNEIIARIVHLEGHDSAAIRSKVKNAQRLFWNEDAPFPKGWVKSKVL